MAELLTIGEPLALFASDEEGVSLAKAKKFTKYLAGAEVNVAVGLSRLNHSVEYVSAVGDDPFGKFLRQAIKQHNVNIKYLYTDPNYATGCMFKSRTSKGDPNTFYLRKNSAGAHLSKEVIDQIDLSNFKWIHITGILPGILESPEVITTLLERARKAEIPISFDPNLRPAIWSSEDKMIKTVNKIAQSAKLVMPGLAEGEILTGEKEPEEIARKYFELSDITETIVIKVGSKGALIFQRSKPESIMVPGYKVDRVVDTVGAGDGFAVGVLSGLLENLQIQEAVKRGNAIGALSVMSPGDNDGYPTPNELAQFMKRKRFNYAKNRFIK